MIRRQFERHVRACQSLGVDIDPFFLGDALLEAARLEKKAESVDLI